MHSAHDRIADVRPAPRKRDAARTREAILRAAQRLFAQNGFSTTGVREIAAEANVNSALVRRYFLSKEGLFRAALEDTLTIQAFIEGPRDEFGDRALRLLTMGLEMPNPLTMMLLAAADPAARAFCGDLLHERTIKPLADWLGGPDAEARATQLSILWSGFMTARQIIPLRAVSDASGGRPFQWLRDTTQSIADEHR